MAPGRERHLCHRQAVSEWGESVPAFVVAAPDCQVKAEELDQLCLARFKRPNEYSFLDALPKNN